MVGSCASGMPHSLYCELNRRHTSFTTCDSICPNRYPQELDDIRTSILRLFSGLTHSFQLHLRPGAVQFVERMRCVPRRRYCGVRSLPRVQLELVPISLVPSGSPIGALGVVIPR